MASPRSSAAACGTETEVRFDIFSVFIFTQTAASGEMHRDRAQCLPLSSFDAGCVPVRKGGRLVWVSPETLAGSSSLPWSGTMRWRAADLKITGTNKVQCFIKADPEPQR